MTSHSTIGHPSEGQTNAEWAERRGRAIARGVGMTTQVYAERAENAELWDGEGRRYIDFAAGIAVVNTGHRHPAVMEAIRAQLDAFTHTCAQVAPYGSYVALAERLNAMLPGDFEKKTVFVTTGAEAVENAVKIARAATGRDAVIAFGGGFHGRTFMGMSLTGKIAPYKAGFGPMMPGIYHAPFPNALHGVTTADALDAVDALFRADVDPKRVAAIIFEPVQGEGGFVVAPQDFVEALRALADRIDAVLIADEVQTGFARTGRYFAMEHYGVAADLTTMAKGLSGGVPLSAVAGKAEIMDAPGPGRARRHVWRQPDRHCSGARRSRCHRKRAAQWPRDGSRRAADGAPPQDLRVGSADRRSARARLHDRG
ncbi:MAG: aminotransferase class III-fold pyridoxal phosphate-dependent enzyme [Parvularculaceae bacterium]